MLDILIVTAPLFLIIFGGAIFQYIGNTENKWESILNEFALKIAFPALIFTALASTNFNFTEKAPLIAANSILILSSFIIAFASGKIFKLKKKTCRTFFILAFGNVGFLGIPTLVQLKGESILPNASLIAAVYLFWMFTIGTGFLEYSQNKHTEAIFKKMALNLAKNPLLISVVLGVLVSSLQIHIPEILEESLNMIADSATPVVLIGLGLFIGKSKIGKLRKWTPMLIFSLFTLFAIPALFYYGIELIGQDPKTFSASIIDAAMPLAITPFVLADQYKLDKNFIAKSIVLSTILSAITIPFWTSIL